VDLDAAAVRASVDDPARFALVFEQHHRAVWAYVARLAGADVADEVAGEVFARALARRARFDPQRGPVRAWLYGIATNVLRARHRSERRARAAFARAAGLQAASSDPAGLTDDAAELAWVSRRVRAAMAELDRDHREVLVLFAWEQCSYAEIAAALDIPVGTVRSRLARARAQVKRAVEADAEALPGRDEEVV